MCIGALFGRPCEPALLALHAPQHLLPLSGDDNSELMECINNVDDASLTRILSTRGVTADWGKSRERFLKYVKGAIEFDAQSRSSIATMMMTYGKNHFKM